MRAQIWEAYYSLQSVGLVPPIVMFAVMFGMAEDRRAMRKWLVIKAVQFIGIFMLATGALSVMETAGIINLLAD